MSSFAGRATGRVEGRGSRQQPDWDDYAEFVDALSTRAVGLLGGPFADYSRILQIVACASENEAEHLVDEAVG